MIKKIGIIGLGTVGEATLRSLQKYGPLIERRKGLTVSVKAVCDARRSKAALAKAMGVSFTTDAYTLLNDPQIDIIVELIGGIEPARTFIREALMRGKHVVTANKALLSQYGSEIFALARRNNRMVGFEASVCGAIPLIEAVSRGLVGCEIKKIQKNINEL